ncbi:nucleotide-binding alpha-beta plait domain-containing protein [Tanacetum coccineum]|uniref:Nucleotide-binding alpha-beta plait domain-containing protein n=1 Tax=Tanacetum coccineum TaxID=301880 RepID=A0ABQ4YL67_9ASTR
MVEEPEKMKKKDQIGLDEELAFKLQAEEEEEEKLAREKAQREEEANIVTWDNVQAMIDDDYQMAQQMKQMNKKELRNKIDCLDTKVESSPLSPFEVESRISLIKLLANFEHRKVFPSVQKCQGVITGSHLLVGSINVFQSNLDRRGVDLDLVRCPVCNEDIEKEDHVFVHCEMAVDIWKDVLNWWQIANTQFHNLLCLKFCVREKIGTKNGETEQTRNGYNHKDEWVNVTRKKRRDRVLDAPHPIKNPLGRKQTSDFDRVMREKSTSFFFTNFPETWDLGDLWKMFRRLKGILIGNERLVINRAKFAKGENMSALHSNFPPLYSGEEDKNIRSRLEMCWISQAKKLYVLQNDWDIMHNNGLGDYNVKYIRGLSLLFEWSSKEVVNKSLEENGVWLQQWFKNIRMWDDDSHRIGRLDFDSQILLHVKCLVLTSSMNEVCQNVSVTLNRKSYPIKISEERFNASSLISSPHPYPGENVMFEEEFVEPSMVVCEDVNSPGCLRLREKEDKKVMSALSPFPIYEAANSCSFPHYPSSSPYFQKFTLKS